MNNNKLVIKTQFICHRINNINQLNEINCIFGVEIDIRDDHKTGKLILAHDPFVDGEDFENYLIETYAIDASICELNENGLALGMHTLYKKEIDPLSPYKINGRICYAMAAQEAKEKKWNDALVLSSHGNIIESSISNIFWIKNKEIFTPPLSEGCIAGIMRAHWIAVLNNKGIPVIEMPLNKELLLQADEVFLTNSVRKIRWVRQFESTYYKLDFINTLV